MLLLDHVYEDPRTSSMVSHIQNNEISILLNIIHKKLTNIWLRTWVLALTYTVGKTRKETRAKTSHDTDFRDIYGDFNSICKESKPNEIIPSLKASAQQKKNYH